MTRLAIISTFNDIEKFAGGSRSSIKKHISYFDQWLMLYSSINRNWNQDKFSFKFYIIHSLPFDKKKLSILKKIKNVEVIFSKYEQHETKIRPLAYKLKIDCDFRLVLDVDMLALKTPNFDFTADFQAMYGGSRYNENQWREVCAFIGAKFPNETILQQEEGNYKYWEMTPIFEYHLNDKFLTERLFPYFNNGAILVRNTLSESFGKLWEEYRLKYADYLSQIEGVNGGIQGQNVIGLAINHISDNWRPFERGFNFVLQENQEKGLTMLQDFDPEKVSLIHYIAVPSDSFYYNKIQNEYSLIQKKYYSLIGKIAYVLNKK